MTNDIDVEIVLEDMDENDLGSIIRTYQQVNLLKQKIEEKRNLLHDKLKATLKERKWDSYKDDQSGISINLYRNQRESVNKNALKMLLNEEQFNQVVTKKSVEQIQLVTPQDRERLKKYAQGKK